MNKAQQLLQALGESTSTISQHDRQKINQELIQAGLDGNGRFPKVGAALSAAGDVLGKHGIEYDDTLNANDYLRHTGSKLIHLAITNPEDSFSPIPVRNSGLHFAWADLGGKFEVVAYLS